MAASATVAVAGLHSGSVGGQLSSPPMPPPVSPAAALTSEPAGWFRAIFAPAVLLLIVAATALNPLDQSDAQPAGSGRASMNAEVAVKLVLGLTVTAVTATAYLLRPSLVSTFLRPGPVLLLATVTIFLATSVTALPAAATVSRAAALIMLVYVLFVGLAVRVTSTSALVRCLLIGLTLHMLVAWALYLRGGEGAVYEEELAGAMIVDRMGSTAHPNSLGRIGGLALMLVIAIWRDDRWRPGHTTIAALIAVVPLAIATVIESKSRTSVLACGAGAIAMLADRFWNRRGILILGSVFAAVCGTLLVLVMMGWASDLTDQLIGSVTKTGDVTELTSATGRDVIWAEAISLIARDPWTGYGLVAAPILLDEHSFHTHNVLLHATFSGGLLAGLTTAALLVWTVYQTARVPTVLAAGVTTYILTSGAVEDTVFETFPFTSTMLWMIVLLGPTATVDPPPAVAA